LKKNAGICVISQVFAGFFEGNLKIRRVCRKNFRKN